MEDRDGKIWIGTQNAGLNCLDPETGRITRFEHDPNNVHSLSYNQVTALYEDFQGTIWVGTGVLWNPPPNYRISNPGGLNRFDRASNNFTRFLHDPDDQSSLIDNRIFSIFEDSKGRLWVGTSGDGLHIMNREKGNFQRHRYNAADKNRISRPPVNNIPGLPDDMISFIKEDSVGAIWVGTYRGGLNRYDPESKKINYYRSLNEQSIEKNKYVHFVGSYISRDGVLWIGSYDDGLYQLDPFHTQISQQDAGALVISLLQDRTGKLWLGTYLEGLKIYDRSGMKDNRVYQDIFNGNSFVGNRVHSIVEARNGTVWIGTNKGLASFDSQKKELKGYSFERDVYSVYEDSQGSLWLGTIKGLELLKRTGVSFGNHQDDNTDTPVLHHIRVSCILEDKAGYLWIGSAEWGGLVSFDKENKKVLHHYLPGCSVQCILRDNSGKLWFGTNKGVYTYNPANKSFERFANLHAGFPEDISVYQILEDNGHFLWMNTSMGIFRLGRDRSEIILMARADENVKKNLCGNSGSRMFQ
jgi:ligand-binding sensor domain-containing protein